MSSQLTLMTMLSYPSLSGREHGLSSHVELVYFQMDTFRVYGTLHDYQCAKSLTRLYLFRLLVLLPLSSKRSMATDSQILQPVPI